MASQKEMDPELASLLGIDEQEDSTSVDYSDLFDEIEFDENKESKSAKKGEQAPRDTFPDVTKRFSENPHNYFNDPNYYKTALSGEGDIAQRVHATLQKYLGAKDPKDRSVYRQQLLMPFWEFLSRVGKKAHGKLPPPKKFLLRFGIFHPGLLKPETREFFAKVVLENELKQPVYYMDEWLKAVVTSEIRPSTTDEAKVAQNNISAKLQQMLEKTKGKLDGAKSLLRAKEHERLGVEASLKDRLIYICERAPVGDLDGISGSYSDGQKRALNEIQDSVKQLFKIDREHVVLMRDFSQAENDLSTLQAKADEEGSAVTIDMGALDAEFGTIRQMAKMSVGRQGNHFPFLASEYFHCGPNDVGIRENILVMLKRIESIDPEAFCRYHKNQLNRIPPLVLLIPTYGEFGFCWEPFDRYNRATSPGRIVIPMYPRNLYITVLSAVADLRWQVAKEKASYYWMEEGLTGHYYQWYLSQKLKGDIKEYFIEDYILWMTKEAEGIQKLSKEIRGSFWRFMPFAQEVKDKLKTRSYVYQELCQRDLNRAMSDGY